MVETLSTFWGKFIDSQPIAAVTGVSYYPALHGMPSMDLPFEDFNGMLIEQSLIENRWPMYRRYRPEIGGTQEEKLDQQFALGALAFMLVGLQRPYGVKGGKTWVRHLCYEEEYSLRDLVARKVVAPLAWVALDFDCSTSDANLSRILPILEATYPHADWVLVDSGGSYYFLIKELIDPQNLPWHYGRLIRAFSQTAISSRRHIFEGMGEQMQKDWKNRPRLAKLSRDILDSICHNDEAHGTKIPFIIDLRHMAHSIQELFRYFEGEGKSFGYLRFSQKKPYPTPPLVKAIHSPELGTKVLFGGTVMNSSKLKLPGI